MNPPINLNLKTVKEIHANNFDYMKKILAPYTLLIHPKYLGDIKKGIKVELDSLKKNYCPNFKGIVLGYDNVIVQPHGRCIDTNPFLHIGIEAEFYIFAPEIGTVLKGKVIKKSPTHVGCLIHDLFNASSSIPNGVSKIDWCGSLAKEGESIDLKVTSVDLTSPVPYLRGDIVPESVVKKESHDETKDAASTHIIVKQEKDGDNIEEEFNQVKIKEEKTKKKKKRSID